jgi:RHS repeat-associated protein
VGTATRRPLFVSAVSDPRPLTIWKQGLGSIVTHQSWRGHFARGTFGEGASRPAGQSSDCTEYPATNGCLPVQWPGWSTSAWSQEAARAETTGSEEFWFGSLSVGMRDASGQQYMRNRYYNPQTGQFTQPDPIGLAGGLNSYGFAGGDPVSYSDPYGLTACNWLTQAEKCIAVRLRTGMAKFGHHINDVEAEYFVREPGVALVAAYVVRTSSGFANQMQARYPGRVGAQNAARHQFGQCLMTRMVGEQIATITAENHESGATDSEDSQRDQANNRIGRALASNLGSTCHEQVESNIATGKYDWEASSASQNLNPIQ